MAEDRRSTLLDTAEECVRHAKDLVRAGRAVLKVEKIPNIAYHLGILALEEVGKSVFLGMIQMAKSKGDEFTWAERRLEDHPAKLFWALFSPNIGSSKITKQSIEEARAFAHRLHRKRLNALYVSPSSEAHIAVSDVVSEDEAKNILGLAEARIGLIGERRKTPLSSEEQETIDWFLSASADERLSEFLFSGPSMEKLAEIGDVKKWVQWLQDTWSAQEKESSHLLESELARQKPEGVEVRADKWLVRFRLFSMSHQIKQGALSWFNEKGAWFKFIPVSGKKDQLLVEITLPKAISIHGLWWAALGHARLITTALNIGTLGLFWWDFLSKQGVFYEKIVDLDTKQNVELKVGDEFKGKFRRQNLKKEDFGNFALCLSALAKEMNQGRSEPFDRYLMGVIFTAKSDVHFSFLSDAYSCFFFCLTEVGKRQGDFSNGDIAKFLGDILPDLTSEQKDHLAALGLADRENPPAKSITLEDVLWIKTICDFYLIKTFRQDIDALCDRETNDNMTGKSDDSPK